MLNASPQIPNGAWAPDITPPTLLVVDDDSSIRALLSRCLSRQGYAIVTAGNVREMEAVLDTQCIDLILLDVMMPGENGLVAAGRHAGSGRPPIVFLSALGEEDDRIAGLDIGASHYLTKPCNSREIAATVRAALRHHHSIEPVSQLAYLFAGWCIDITSHELLDPQGVLVDLTDGEFAVLRAFVERPRRVLARDALLEAARGSDTSAHDRAIDVQVSRLRRKLRPLGDELIRTIRNEGYLFTPQVSRR